ncbi:MAG: HD domain-containing protein [Lachnospiraceae bacterium]|nr:HD domain-containing protein [Lachnospiraceae bacterium]
MAIATYGICLVISCGVILWMSSKDYDNIDRYYWTIVILIPVIILGYWLKTMVVTEEAAAITFCFIYLDSTILLTVMLFLMLRTIGIKANPWLKGVVYVVAILHLFVVWGCVHNDRYFKKIHIIPSDAGTITKMEGGPLRIYHYIYLGIIVSALLAILVAGIIRKGTYSRRTLFSYAFIMLVGITVYAIEWIVDIDFSLLPYLYVFGDLMIAAQYGRIHMHDISFILSEHQQKFGTRGYAAFDLQGRFLGSNSHIFFFWPELAYQRIDERLPEDSALCRVFYTMIEAYEKRGETTAKYRIGDKTCICEVTPFSLSRSGDTRGYFFDARDASQEQKNLDLITSYNDSLNTLVAQKTQSILEMQEKIVTGMANMIENRDNNTGGHVKRTSDIIRIFINEIRRQEAMSIGADFAQDIVRAAPTHDLGKITIENSILNKPAKLTDEEYMIMKTHAPKSGEMVLILLEGVEEKHFVQVAFNVARYHHERWDGRGYPDGLVGSLIPIEARIMAVADVYDALASKRSYKEAMDPGLVAKIMLEGMGTQFDPALKPIFLGCRAKLEAYYARANQ